MLGANVINLMTNARVLLAFLPFIVYFIHKCKPNRVLNNN